MNSPLHAAPTKLPALLVLVAFALPLGGCQAALWANLGALVVTLALFVGTLQLRRGPRAPSASSHGASAVSSVAEGSLRAPSAKPATSASTHRA